MLRIMSGKLAKGRHYYAGGTIAFSSVCGSIRYAAFRDMEVQSEGLGRSHCDYLHQGGVFDRFGNTFVDNLQISGDLSAVPTFNGTRASGSGVSPRSTAVSVSSPASFTTGSYTYAILNLGPAHVGGYGGNGTRVYASAIIAMAIGHGNQIGVITGTASSSWLRSGKYEGSNVRLSIGGTQLGYNGETLAYTSMIDSGLSNYKFDKKRPDSQVAGFVPTVVDALYAATNVAAIEYYRQIRENPRRTYGSSSINVSQWDSGVVDPQKVRQWVEYVNTFSSHLPFSSADLSTHAREVIESLNDFDSNLLAYGADLRKTGDTLREVLKLSRNIKSPKAWASAWLSGRYGDRLAVSDTKELLESIQRKLTTRASYALARKRIATAADVGPVKVVTERTSTVVAADESYSGLMTAVYNLMKWDAWPTLENTWDMIPLSFVVDWVLPVQDILGQIDAAVEAPYIKPITEYTGTKTTASFTIPTGSDLAGSFDVKRYTRQHHSVLGEVKPFEANLDFLPSFSVINAGDALALTVSLKGHR